MSQSTDAVMAHVGDTLGGRYLLSERVGAGGMGRVFRARDAVLGRDVAIKLFHTDRVDELEPGRRLSEARVLAALDHPSLVTLYDARLDGEDHVYLVMEYVDGPSLQRRIEAGPLQPEFVAALLADLADGLAAVHATGVVHRDVKPSNVLLRPTRHSPHGHEAVLADFGVAHLIDATRLTTPGTVIGTAAYLAPEQVRGEPPRPASDIYALGLLTIEALTRLHPYGGGTLQETVLARLSRPPAIPSSLGYEWKALLTAMTALEPSARPTAAAVIERAKALASPGYDASPDASELDVLGRIVAETAPWTLLPEPVSAPPAPPLSDAAARGDAPEVRVVGERRRTPSHRRRPRLGAWIGAAAAGALLVGGHLLAFSAVSPTAPLTVTTPSAPVDAPVNTPAPAQEQAENVPAQQTVSEDSSVDTVSIDSGTSDPGSGTEVAPPEAETPTEIPDAEAPREEAPTRQRNDPPRGPDENAAGTKPHDGAGNGRGRGSGDK
ncbi:MAG: serine/threonine protein kinase [Microbacterium sp.]|jgi:serine/threonine protein kinase|nr:serine/threonine protein kinase [Microbacterium sp.]